MNKRPLIYNTSDSLCQGKSFRFIGEWDPNRPYINDEGFQDFVAYNGSMWACMENNKGVIPDESFNYWEMVCAKGETGDPYVLTEEDKTAIAEYIYHTHLEGNVSAYDVAKEVWEMHHDPEKEPFMDKEAWIAILESQIVTSHEGHFIGMPKNNPDDVVRYTPQSRSSEAKTIARDNIDAAFVDDILVVDEADEHDAFYTIAQDNQTLYNHALVYDRQLLDDEKLEQVQENLHIADEGRVSNLEKTVNELSKADVSRLGDINQLHSAVRFQPDADHPDTGAGARTSTVPLEETFLNAINRLLYYLGDPIENNFIGLEDIEEQNGIIDTLNYIKDHLTTGTIKRKEAWKGEVPEEEKESVTTYAFYREEDGSDTPYAWIDIPNIICEDPNLDPTSEEFNKSVWDRVKDPTTGEYTSRGPEDLTIKLTSYYQGNSEDAEGDLIKDHPNAFTIYADLLEGKVRHKHLDDDVNAELDLIGYEHILDEDYYYKSVEEDTTGAIEITAANLEEITKNSLESEKRKGLIVEGNFVKKFEKSVDPLVKFNQLTTESQTLREAINELNGKNERIKELNVVVYEIPTEAESPYHFIDGTVEGELEDGISKLYEIVTASIIDGEEELHTYHVLKENNWVISYVSKTELLEKVELVDGKWVSIDFFVKPKAYIPTIYIISEDYPDDVHTENIRYYSNSIWTPINRPEDDVDFKVYYQVTESLDKRIGNMKDIEIFDDEAHDPEFSGNFYLVETINEIAHRSERIRSINIVGFNPSDDTMVSDNFIDGTDVTLLEEGDKLIKFVTRGLTYKEDTTYDHTYYIRAEFYTPSTEGLKPEEAISDQDAYQLTMSINSDNTIGANLIYEDFDTPDPDVPTSTKNIDFTDETSFEFK